MEAIERSYILNNLTIYKKYILGDIERLKAKPQQLDIFMITLRCTRNSRLCLLVINKKL